MLKLFYYDAMCDAAMFSCCKTYDAFPASCRHCPQVKDPLASTGGVASSLGRIGKTMAQHFLHFLSWKLSSHWIKPTIKQRVLHYDHRSLTMWILLQFLWKPQLHSKTCCYGLKAQRPLKTFITSARSKSINPTESNGVVLACDTAALLPLVSVEVDKAAAIDALSGEIAASLVMRHLLICVSADARQLSTSELMAAGEILVCLAPLRSAGSHEAAQVANKKVGAQGSFEWVFENTACLVANMPFFLLLFFFYPASA